MQEVLTVVTRKGQITIPVEIRRMLDIKRGDKVALVVTDPEQGVVMLRRVPSIAEETYGAVNPCTRPEDLKALREQATDDMATNAEAEGRDSADK